MECKPTQVTEAEGNPLAFPASNNGSTEVYHHGHAEPPGRGTLLSSAAAISSSS